MAAPDGVRTTTTACRPLTPSRRWEKWSGDSAVHTSTSAHSATPASRSAMPTAEGTSSDGVPQSVRDATVEMIGEWMSGLWATAEAAHV